MPASIRHLQVRVDAEQKERLDEVRRTSGRSLQQFLEELLETGIRNFEREQNRTDIHWEQLAGDEEELADLVVRIYRKKQRNDLEEAAIRLLEGLRNLRERDESQGKRKPASPANTIKKRS